MNYFEQVLLRYLWDGQLEMRITGFDVEKFEKSMSRELDHRLDMIKSIVYENSKTSSDAEKIAAIKLLFKQKFYS